VAKGDVAGWPIIGAVGLALGVIFVTRSDPMARARTLRRIHALLRAGVPVLNFAEGTTTRGDRVRPFWRGSFGIAQRLGVPVIPVALRYRDPGLAWCDEATFLPHYLRTAASNRIHCTLSFGAAILPRAGELPEDMAARTRNAVGRALDRINHAGISAVVSSSRPHAVLPAARVA
jgi:1-acyl-sn-glycerol-3-phosphate acyltransferase